MIFGESIITLNCCKRMCIQKRCHIEQPIVAKRIIHLQETNVLRTALYFYVYCSCWFATNGWSSHHKCWRPQSLWAPLNQPLTMWLVKRRTTMRWYSTCAVSNLVCLGVTLQGQASVWWEPWHTFWWQKKATKCYVVCNVLYASYLSAEYIFMTETFHFFESHTQC